MSNPPAVASARTERALLIVFADLTRFMVNSRRVVKFMGDAFLAVWPEERAGAGVAALPGLKRDIDAWWAARGWDSRVVVKAHFGRAAMGPFGRDEHFDVVGSEVNVAATLPARTVSLSAEAFRCLENGERKAYKKHTAPVVYIPVDDPRP